MKKILFVLMCLFIIGCSETTTEKENCLNACNEWEKCENNTCVLIENKCYSDEDCLNGNKCSETHNCTENNLCSNVTCDGKGICEIQNNQPVCICNNGYSANGLHCVIKSCEKCEIRNTETGFCEFDGGRNCIGEYNNRCEPENIDLNGKNTDCLSGICFGETFETAYCSKENCGTDDDCKDINNPDEHFICLKYNETHKGICKKTENSQCFATERILNAYEQCNSNCNHSDCKQEFLCLEGFCSPECLGIDDLTSCIDGYKCYNVNSIENPFYRCLEEKFYCLNDLDCENGTVCNGFYLDEIINQEAVLTMCEEKTGTKKYGDVCNPHETNKKDMCESGLCMKNCNGCSDKHDSCSCVGSCSMVCNSSENCNIEGMDHNICVSLQLFSNTEAFLPVCVTDDLVFETARFQGICKNNCNENSICQPNIVASVVDGEEDIEYICFSGLDAGNKEFGEICNQNSECKSLLCHNNLCNSFCDINSNCPETYNCLPQIRYYTENVNNDTQLKICVSKDFK